VRGFSWRGLAALVGWSAGACKGHVQAEARVAASTEADDRKWEITEPASAEPVMSPAASAVPIAEGAPDSRSTETGFFGVMHDLSLAPRAQRIPVCRCLAVAYGPVTDPQFAWVADRPKAAPGVAAVAIAADGVACDGPPPAPDPSRASIAGVERDGVDVIVTIETISEGRPVMHGALIEPPGPGGSLLVRALGGAPYGAPLNGGPGPCRVVAR
jgi:hypothetical protein